MKELYIIGCGMGKEELLTGESKAALIQCEEVYAFDRMAKHLSALHPGITACTYSELIPMVSDTKSDIIGVLVSGDTGFFSAARSLCEKFKDNFTIHITSGISSLQYLCSKLRIGYEEISIISLHGRNRSILGSLAYHRKTFVLTGSDHNASEVLKELADMGLSHIRVTVGEFLSMEQERILTGTVGELVQYQFDNLSVLLFENDNPANKNRPLFDHEFIRDKVPMTKQEVRWASIQYLELQPSDIVFDIGAGTGSVSIEMSRKVYEGKVYSIEKEEDAFLLLNRNKEKFGAFNVITGHGNAMELLQELPVPDKAFIGGSGKELTKILDYLLEQNRDVKVVINAITLETLSSAIIYCEEQACKIQVSCMNVSHSKPAGDYHLMMANNPVYIILVEKKEG